MSVALGCPCLTCLCLPCLAALAALLQPALPACPACPPWVQEDDQDIQQEGLDSLTVDELRQACRWACCWCGLYVYWSIALAQTVCWDRNTARVSRLLVLNALLCSCLPVAPSHPTAAGRAACAPPLGRALPSSCGSSWQNGSTGPLTSQSVRLCPIAYSPVFAAVSGRVLPCCLFPLLHPGLVLPADGGWVLTPPSTFHLCASAGPCPPPCCSSPGPSQ
jgi:hypothetical protein